MSRAALASFVLKSTAFGVLSAGVSTAQQPQSAKPLQFEVAAVKPSNPGTGVSSSSNVTRDQFRMVNMPLKQWVEMALSVSDYALKAPSWLETSRFDLDAKLPSQPVDQRAGSEMMKTLLIERFGLKWHEEPGIVSGYELVADKKVLAQPASLLEQLKGYRGSSSGPTLISGTNVPMSELAEALGKVLGKPVMDTTHLSGGFDFKLIWRPPGDPEAAEWKRRGMDVDNLPDSVFTALREQLGLRLQSARVPSRVIVVDNINRQPTEN